MSDEAMEWLESLAAAEEAIGDILIALGCNPQEAFNVANEVVDRWVEEEKIWIGMRNN